VPLSTHLHVFLYLCFPVTSCYLLASTLIKDLITLLIIVVFAVVALQRRIMISFREGTTPPQFADGGHDLQVW
jgi:hypothetical protein